MTIMPFGLQPKNGFVKVVKLLLANVRVNPAARNNQAMQLADQNGHVKIVERLRADPRVNVDIQ